MSKGLTSAESSHWLGIEQYTAARVPHDVCIHTHDVETVAGDVGCDSHVRIASRPYGPFSYLEQVSPSAQRVLFGTVLLVLGLARFARFMSISNTRTLISYARQIEFVGEDYGCEPGEAITYAE